MTPRQQRMLLAGFVLAGVALAVTLALRAFQDNLLFFYTPSQVIAGESPPGRKFRLGGLVEEGSVTRESGQLRVQFRVTDLKQSMRVYYDGVLPDLFREGQGVIALGYFDPGQGFRADEVLAKHDENYMPPEVAASLNKMGHPGGAGNKPAGVGSSGS